MDRREEPRFPMETAVEFTINDDGGRTWHDGNIRDVSESGLQITSRLRLRVGCVD